MDKAAAHPDRRNSERRLQINQSSTKELPRSAWGFNFKIDGSLNSIAPQMLMIKPSMQNKSECTPHESREASGDDQETNDKANTKALRRQAQNREAARKCRLRKKAYVQQLETSCVKLMQLELEIEKARKQQGMYICSALDASYMGSSGTINPEDESDFSYDEKSENGPSRWGDIRPEWSFCSNGSMQSPIDLLNERVQIGSYLGRLQMNYQPSNATIKNRGHDIKLEWVAGAGYLQINETKYVLKQCHWHSPSEHTIDGKRLDLELHMVHETSSGQSAVIGILYKIGRPDSFLSSLTDYLRAISDTTGAERVVGVVDPRQIKIFYKQYYRYIGSLTIPPCTENVSWTIVREIQSVSKEQVRLLRVAVHDESDTNARPLQLINNRLVQLYGRKYIKDKH